MKQPKISDKCIIISHNKQWKELRYQPKFSQNLGLNFSQYTEKLFSVH